jgi:hypothetical protein
MAARFWHTDPGRRWLSPHFFEEFYLLFAANLQSPTNFAGSSPCCCDPHPRRFAFLLRVWLLLALGRVLRCAHWLASRGKWRGWDWRRLRRGGTSRSWRIRHQRRRVRHCPPRAIRRAYVCCSSRWGRDTTSMGTFPGSCFCFSFLLGHGRLLNPDQAFIIDRHDFLGVLLLVLQFLELGFRSVLPDHFFVRTHSDMHSGRGFSDSWAQRSFLSKEFGDGDFIRVTGSLLCPLFCVIYGWYSYDTWAILMQYPDYLGRVSCAMDTIATL